MVRASAIIIGNEVLNGKVQDANSVVLAKTLFDCGVTLSLIETIPDSIDRIASTVQRHSQEFDLVFTSGGIGPTHDDITYEGVARAFNRPLVLHEETVEKFRTYYHREPNEAQKKMARLPEGSEIILTPPLLLPTVYIERTYILPGIPELFCQVLEAIRSRFTYQGFSRALVYTTQPESLIAYQLESVQKRFPDLEIGSYPQSNQVMFSIEGSDGNRVEQAAAEIRQFA